MHVTIEILNPLTAYPTKAHIQTNIDALTRALRNEPRQAADDQLLVDTLSILEGIQRELPDA